MYLLIRRLVQLREHMSWRTFVVVSHIRLMVNVPGGFEIASVASDIQVVAPYYRVCWCVSCSLDTMFYHCGALYMFMIV